MTTGCYRFTICLLIALLPATCVAQFEIPQSQLDYTKSELDKYRGKLAKAISGIDYKDPGKESGWQQSLAAWESMDFRPGYPSEEIAKGLGIDNGPSTAHVVGARRLAERSFLEWKVRLERWVPPPLAKNVLASPTSRHLSRDN